MSSQFLTGLLLAYAAFDAKNVTIKVNNLKSKPYVDLTLSVMESFLLKVPENRNYEAFYFDETPVNTNDDFVDYTVEGDWSGGAFLLVAGAIAGNINVKGLDIASTQADKKILEALESCGADIRLTENEIEITFCKCSYMLLNLMQQIVLIYFRHWLHWLHVVKAQQKLQVFIA